MKRTKADADNTRHAIIAAALKVFSSKGYDAATLEEIASHAGMTRGAVYWHFRNKEVLLNSMLDEFELALEAEIETAFSPEIIRTFSLSELALHWISLWVRYLVTHRNLFRTRLLHNTLHPEMKTLERTLTNQRFMSIVVRSFITKFRDEFPAESTEMPEFLIMTLDTSITYRILLDENSKLPCDEPGIRRMIHGYHVMFCKTLDIPKADR